MIDSFSIDKATVKTTLKIKKKIGRLSSFS